MSQKTKDWVDAKIRGKKVVVFSKSYCPYCKKAKVALDKHKGEINGDIEIIEIENLPDCKDIQNVLGKLTGAQSVPRVFINGKFLGGGDETEKAAKDGKLSELLKQK